MTQSASKINTLNIWILSILYSIASSIYEIKNTKYKNVLQLNDNLCLSEVLIQYITRMQSTQQDNKL